MATASWRRNEFLESRRTCSVMVVSAATGQPTPAGTDLSGKLQIRAGTSWASAVGSFEGTGKNGAWVYTGTQADAGHAVNELELRIDDGTYFAQEIIVMSGVSSGAGLLISHTPTGPLSDDEDTARWTPVVLTINVPDGMSVVIIAMLQDEDEDPAVLTHTTYSDELGGFQPMFEDKSSLTVDGSDVTFTVLPNGGWTRPNVTLVPYVAWECDVASGAGGGAGTLISYTNPGQLAITPDLARRTPVGAVYQTPAGMSLVSIALIGTNTYFPIVMYSDELDGLQTMFAPGLNSLNQQIAAASQLAVTGTIGSGRSITASWLPQGGWIREAVQIISYVAFEATP